MLFIDEAISALAQHCSRLRELSLEQCEQVLPAVRLPVLRERLRRAFCFRVARLSADARIAQVGDAAVFSLALHGRALARVNLSFCSLSEGAIFKLVQVGVLRGIRPMPRRLQLGAASLWLQQCEQLSSLNTFGCSNLSTQAQMALMGMMSKHAQPKEPEQRHALGMPLARTTRQTPPLQR